MANHPYAASRSDVDAFELTIGIRQFINLASGSNLPVGRGLESCTSEVRTSRPFLLNGRIVTLIDTPGFDDTTRSDTDILSSIAAYLSNT